MAGGPTMGGGCPDCGCPDHDGFIVMFGMDHLHSSGGGRPDHRRGGPPISGAPSVTTLLRHGWERECPRPYLRPPAAPSYDNARNLTADQSYGYVDDGQGRMLRRDFPQDAPAGLRQVGILSERKSGPDTRTITPSASLRQRLRLKSASGETSVSAACCADPYEIYRGSPPPSTPDGAPITGPLQAFFACWGGVRDKALVSWVGARMPGLGRNSARRPLISEAATLNLAANPVTSHPPWRRFV